MARSWDKRKVRTNRLGNVRLALQGTTNFAHARTITKFCSRNRGYYTDRFLRRGGGGGDGGQGEARGHSIAMCFLLLIICIVLFSFADYSPDSLKM